jgi:hypothetical protein
MKMDTGRFKCDRSGMDALQWTRLELSFKLLVAILKS